MKQRTYVSAVKDGPAVRAPSEKPEQPEEKDKIASPVGDAILKELSAADVFIGMRVRTISGKDKEALHDKEAEVTVVNLASLHVLLCEGPRRGDTIKRTYKQIAVIQHDPKKTEWPEARRSPKRERQGDEEDGASKRAKGEARAAAIFAKAPVSEQND